MHTYAMPQTAAQFINAADYLMGAISRLETSTEANHKASKFSSALTANANCGASWDYAIGLSESAKLRVAILAMRFAADVADEMEGADAYDIYEKAVDMQAPAIRIWRDGGSEQPIARNQWQAELFA